MDPILFHAHQSLHSSDVPFWIDLAARTGGPILELGCGTGRILLRLAKDGHAVTGLDNDPLMLQYLRDSVPIQFSQLVQVIEADMRSFQMEEQFPLVFVPCNTYSTFSAQDRLKILRCSLTHLTPGGSFAFSIPNPALLAGQEPFGEPELEDTFPHPISGQPVEVVSSWIMADKRITFTFQYEHRLTGGEIIRNEHSTTHYLDSPQTYLSELRSAGLRPTNAFGDFDFSKAEKDSLYIIMLAERV